MPFKVMFPPETPLDIPLVQVSTFHGYDLASQHRLGEALQSLRSDGFVVVGSGMAVHSFASLGEISEAPSENKDAVRAKVLAESKRFDKAIRGALAERSFVDRKASLLALESLYEYKRSHPTVEVCIEHGCLVILRPADRHNLAFYAPSSSCRSSW